MVEWRGFSFSSEQLPLSHSLCVQCSIGHMERARTWFLLRYTHIVVCVCNAIALTWLGLFGVVVAVSSANAIVAVLFDDTSVFINTNLFVDYVWVCACSCAVKAKVERFVSFMCTRVLVCPSVQIATVQNRARSKESGRTSNTNDDDDDACGLNSHIRKPIDSNKTIKARTQ